MTKQRRQHEHPPRAQRANRSTFGDDLVAAMREVVAIERGESTPARVIRVPLTARRVMAAPAPQYDAAHVKRVRARLKLSQSVFAQTLNVSSGTVRAWEQGLTTPSGPALRLLEIAERAPQELLLAVRER